LGSTSSEAKEEPKNPIRIYNNGLETIKKGDIKKSAELFNESAENTEDNTLKKKALLGLANQQLRMGDPKHALENYQRAYNLNSEDDKFNEEANQRISENIALASRILKQMQKSQGEGNPEQGEGEQPNSNPKDPKGPQQFSDQNFDGEQKKKIFDLVAEQEWQTQQRLQEGKNRGKPRQKQEKPW
jgi:tetratricopeptide (TPR) repeat protein